MIEGALGKEFRLKPVTREEQATDKSRKQELAASIFRDRRIELVSSLYRKKVRALIHQVVHPKY